jgi:hypothetical protein
VFSCGKHRNRIEIPREKSLSLRQRISAADSVVIMWLGMEPRLASLMCASRHYRSEGEFRFFVPRFVRNGADFAAEANELGDGVSGLVEVFLLARLVSVEDRCGPRAKTLA